MQLYIHKIAMPYKLTPFHDILSKYSLAVQYILSNIFKWK